jgi:hypothetical protein
MTTPIRNNTAGSNALQQLQKRVETQAKSTPATTPATNTVAAKVTHLFKDGFDQPRAGGPSLTGESRKLLSATGGGTTTAAPAANDTTAAFAANNASGSGSVPQLSREDEEAASEILNYNDPEKLNTWLEEHPDPARQASMIAYLSQVPDYMASMLGKNLSEEGKERIADAFGHALRTGAITTEQIAEYGKARTESPQIGEIIGMTHNQEAITAFVNGTLGETGQGDDGIDPRRAQAAAFALSGLNGRQLDNYLNTQGQQLDQILDMIGGNGDERSQAALGALLSSAARIPHGSGNTVSQGVVDLFTRTTSMLGENLNTIEGATDFFKRHGDAILRHPSFSDPQTGHLTPQAETTLNEFWARTMFQGVEYEGQSEFREWAGNWMGRLTSELARVPEEENGGNATPDQQEAAARLGGLIGTIENGFRTAVDILKDKNAAIEGLVDFVFQAKDLIPGMKFPGANQAVDATVGQVRDWVVGLLDHDIPSASSSLPFHDQFSQQIDNQELRESYSVSRSEVVINDGIVGIRD